MILLQKKILISTLITCILILGCIGGPSKPSEKTSEPIEVKGSDTMVQMVSNLAEAYMEKYPDRRVLVTGGGSGTGIAALINGEVQIADASRRIKDIEIQTARNKGIDPWEFIITRDGLCVVVNPTNPVEKLTLDQVSKIYKGEITNWKELGGRDQRITLYGRQSTSGTYVYFRDSVVKAEYSPEMRNMEGNSQIRDAVVRDENGIGYIGVGYAVDEEGKPLTTIKVLKIAEKFDGKYVSPLDEETVKKGEYPITRELYQYTAGKPEKNGSVHLFLLYEISDEGQEVVKESGFFKITQADHGKNQELFTKI